MPSQKLAVLVLALVLAGLGAFVATVEPVFGIVVIVLAVILFVGGTLEASMSKRS